MTPSFFAPGSSMVYLNFPIQRGIREGLTLPVIKPGAGCVGFDQLWPPPLVVASNPLSFEHWLLFLIESRYEVIE
jgi:hypothetical protein